MLSVTVHKDIGEYTEKVVGKLSARTLACTAGGLAASVGAAAAVHLGLGVEVADATLPVMAASMLPAERPRPDRRARRAARRKGAEIAEPSRQEGEE